LTLENSSEDKPRSTKRQLPREELGDFSVGWRVLWIIALAVPIGALAAVSALVLLRLISFFTNVFYYGRFSIAMNSPANHHLGWFVVLVPVVGGIAHGTSKKNNVASKLSG
jgi:chloride channel protein, CIC family